MKLTQSQKRSRKQATTDYLDQQATIGKAFNQASNTNHNTPIVERVTEMDNIKHEILSEVKIEIERSSVHLLNSVKYMLNQLELSLNIQTQHGVESALKGVFDSFGEMGKHLSGSNTTSKQGKFDRVSEDTIYLNGEYYRRMDKQQEDRPDLENMINKDQAELFLRRKAEKLKVPYESLVKGLNTQVTIEEVIPEVINEPVKPVKPAKQPSKTVVPTNDKPVAALVTKRTRVNWSRTGVQQVDEPINRAHIYAVIDKYKEMYGVLPSGKDIYKFYQSAYNEALILFNHKWSNVLEGYATRR